MTTKRSWDVLTDEQRKDVINTIIDYYQTERDETIGVIAAGELVDMFLEAAGKHIYNKGVEDTKEFLKTSIDTALFDLEGSVKK